MPHPSRRFVLLALVALLALAALAPAPAAADNHEPGWAPADQATVTPGVQTVTAGGQCTANFVFFDSTDIYIGQAAHCAGTGGATATNGCQAGSQPLGTSVNVQGASNPGTLVYSSWLTMQEVGETDSAACTFNDFALVRLNPADHASVNPSIPFFGGPEGINTTGTSTGEQVYTYGNSSLRLGLAPLSPKQGISLGTSGGGWSHDVYTLTPGIPGDSGSAFLDSSGNAVGVLVTLQVAPLVGSNGVTDLAHALDYLNQNSNLSVTLATGTEPFQPSLLPLPVPLLR